MQFRITKVVDAKDIREALKREIGFIEVVSAVEEQQEEESKTMGFYYDKYKQRK